MKKPPQPADPAMLERYRLLLQSEKFLRWKPSEPESPKPDGSGRIVEQANLMNERHYTPQELANLWGVDPETIRNIFREEPGVVKIGNNNKKRSYVTLRIPESVAERVHQRLSA
jgi:hypothetical protein